MSSSSQAPQVWRYAVVALLALVVLIPLWMMFVSLVIQPEYTRSYEVGMTNKLMWWLIAPVVAVTVFTGWRWQVASSQAGNSPQQLSNIQGPLAVRQSAEEAAKAHREYVLEIIGMGVTLDKFRQGKLWDALQAGHPFSSIREQDPKKYPWSRDDKDGQEGGRAASTLENGIGNLPLYWPAPSFHADNPATDPNEPISETNPVVGLVASTESNGLAWTLFVSAGWALSEHPDRIVEKAFEFFDAHPDVPYLVVSATDGLYYRNLYRPEGTPPLVYDGYYVPSMPGSSALFVLARRERVDGIRAHAVDDVDHKALEVDDLNRRGLARRFGLAFLELRKKVPQPEGSVGRNPTVHEWLDESKRLSTSADFYPPETYSTYAERFKHPLGGGVVHAPKDFKPTPWFPVPWSKWQLGMFDALPTLGYLHRPTYIKLSDNEGKPLQRRDERVKALTEGWQQALMTLPEAQRKSALKRIITATGSDTDKTVALSSMVNAQAEAGGPELDASKSSQWINTDARLGNTGAATWFVQMGIGVMGSYIDGGVSAAINLRDDKEASVIFISPPPADKIKKQGAGVFKNNTKPAIDPANYEQP
jgi:Protein of unknown function (DUF2875)